MRVGWVQALPATPQTTPRGEFWAFILALTYSQTLIVPRRLFGARFWVSIHLSPSGPLKKLWTRVGSLVSNKRSSVEVRHVGSHATAADVVERHAQLPEVLVNNMADTLTRMSVDTMECDEARVQFQYTSRATRLQHP